MSVTDSMQNLRVVSEIAVRAYGALVERGLWPRSRRNESPLGAIALVGLGAVVGAGVALALAPSAGSDLRSSLGEKLRVFGKDWLGGLGLDTQTVGADVQGEGGDGAEAKGSEASNGTKNGSSRRKQAHQGSSNVS